MKHALVLCLLAACGPTGQPDAGEGGCPALEPACPSPQPSYQSDVLPIMEKECLPCHTPPGPPYSGINLSTWQQANAYASTIKYDLFICRMPNGDGGPGCCVAGGVPPISDADKLTIMDWCTCGAPDN